MDSGNIPFKMSLAMRYNHSAKYRTCHVCGKCESFGSENFPSVCERGEFTHKGCTLDNSVCPNRLVQGVEVHQCIQCGEDIEVGIDSFAGCLQCGRPAHVRCMCKCLLRCSGCCTGQGDSHGKMENTTSVEIPEDSQR